MGGVAGALAHQADGILKKMTPHELAITKALFLRLVSPTLSRHRVPEEKLLKELGEGAEDALQLLVDSRIVVRHGSRTAQVAHSKGELELAHESLITRWDPLRTWLAESDEERRRLDELERAAHLWDQRHRRESELWSKDAVEETQTLLKRSGHKPGKLAREFLRHSKARNRRRRSILYLSFGLTLGIILLVTFGSIYLAISFRDKEQVAMAQEKEMRHQKSLAQHQRSLAVERHRSALAQQAETLASDALSTYLMGSMLTARAKVRSSLALGDSLLARSLWWRLSHTPIRWRHRFSGRILDMALYPDGSRLAVAFGRNDISIIDAQTKVLLPPLKGHERQVTHLAFNVKGNYLLSLAEGGELLLWSKGVGPAKVLSRKNPESNGIVAISPQGKWVAMVLKRGKIQLFELPAGNKGRQLSLTQHSITALDFSPDGKRLLAGTSSGRILLQGINASQPEFSISAGGRAITALHFSYGGNIIGAASDSNAIRLFDATTGKAKGTLRARKQHIRDFSFSSVRPIVAATGHIPEIFLFDLGNMTQTGSLTTTSVPSRITLSRLGNNIYYGSRDGTLGSLTLNSSPPETRHRFAPNPLRAMAISKEGAFIATCDETGKIHIWNQKEAKRVRELQLGSLHPEVLAFSPREDLLALGTAQGTITLLPLGSRSVGKAIQGHRGRVTALAFSPDGESIASGGEDNLVTIWNPFTGRPIRQFKGENETITSMVFNPKGTRLATASLDHKATIWAIKTGTPIKKVTFEHPIQGVEYLSQKEGLLIATREGRLFKWAEKDKTPALLKKLKTPLASLKVTSGGTKALLGTRHGKLLYLDLSSGQERTRQAHRHSLTTAHLDPKGQYGASISSDGTLRLFTLPSLRPLWRAPLLLGSTTPPRLFTGAQWVSLEKNPKHRSVGQIKGFPKELLNQIIMGTTSADRRSLCAVTTAGRLVRFDLEKMKILWLKEAKESPKSRLSPTLVFSFKKESSWRWGFHSRKRSPPQGASP